MCTAKHSSAGNQAIDQFLLGSREAPEGGIVYRPDGEGNQRPPNRRKATHIQIDCQLDERKQVKYGLNLLEKWRPKIDKYVHEIV
ncbi:unnamed protein product [Protopolystoma xenopodis]|uniref:Uncharacterized protein n=1 Tax=Protopolystoma xenopodis TaxID=117903 RepID=A0A3S5AQ66_9PLAT|nr:unnamed protein product [Protopolystoma xenopodis]